MLSPEKQINTLIKETRIIVRHAPNQLVQGWNRNMWTWIFKLFSKGDQWQFKLTNLKFPKIGNGP